MKAEENMNRRSILLAGIASTVIIGFFAAGGAFATPPSGVSSTFSGRGTAVEKVKTRGNQPYDVVVQEITIAPGGSTGWHTHPGIAVAVVADGALTVYDGDDSSCSGQTYEAGDVYVDPGYGHVHYARNEGADPTLVLVTYLDVPVGAPDGPIGEGIRIDAPNPGNCAHLGF